MQYSTIKFNTWTETYYITWIGGYPVTVTKNATPKMKEFMKDHTPKKEGCYIIWRVRN